MVALIAAIEIYYKNITRYNLEEIKCGIQHCFAECPLAKANCLNNEIVARKPLENFNCCAHHYRIFLKMYV